MDIYNVFSFLFLFFNLMTRAHLKKKLSVLVCTIVIGILVLVGETKNQSLLNEKNRVGKAWLGFRLSMSGRAASNWAWASLSLSFVVSPAEGTAPPSPLLCELPTGKCPGSLCKLSYE